MLAVRFALLGLALAGCFHDAPPPRAAEPQPTPIMASSGGSAPRARTRSTPVSGDPMADAIARFEQFSDEMCACSEHDSTCAQQVSDAMVAWSQEIASKVDPEVKPDRESTRRLQEIAQRMGECSMKAMSPPPSPSLPSGNPCGGDVDDPCAGP